MFSFTKPITESVRKFLSRAAATDFSYPDVGATRTAQTIDGSVYNIDDNHIVIGNGFGDFEKAKDAIRNWKMFDIPWVDLCLPNTPIEEGQTVAILIRHFGFYSLNAARIVYTIDESDRFGFAYGTLEDHGESGEERFSVRLDQETGDVIYDLFAFSRPSHFLAEVGYP